MALIKCPECGKEISDKAPQCIHCGCPINNKVDSNTEETNNLFEYNGKYWDLSECKDALLDLTESLGEEMFEIADSIYDVIFEDEGVSGKCKAMDIAQ